YAKHSVQVEKVPSQIAAQSSQLLVSGEVNVGGGLVQAIQAVARSNNTISLIDLGDILIHPPITFNAKPSINSYRDLVGQTIALSTPTDNTTVCTAVAFAKLGLPSAQIEKNPVGATA